MIDSALFITALLPVLVLILYINRKDKMSPEPVGQLIRAFLLGLLSAPLSFVISVPSEMIGLYSEVVATVGDALRISFFGAAIPEEAAKLFILWIVVRNNKYFDEKMDGIVYAVCVSMGFAALENARQTALLEKKDILVKFTASWCKNCHAMERTTLQDAGVKKYIDDNFIMVTFPAEDPTRPEIKAILEEYEIPGFPAFVILQSSDRQQK